MAGLTPGRPNLGKKMANFIFDSTDGWSFFYDWFGTGFWGLLLTFPQANAELDTNEIVRIVELFPEFEKRKVKVAGICCDELDDLKELIKVNEEINRTHLMFPEDKQFPFPLVTDTARQIADKFEVMNPDEGGDEFNYITYRAVFIIDPHKITRLIMHYPSSCGRSFSEILRVLDAMQLSDKYEGNLNTPVNWKPGEDLMVHTNLRNREAKLLFPDVYKIHLPSGRKYYRKTPEPEFNFYDD